MKVLFWYSGAAGEPCPDPVQQALPVTVALDSGATASCFKQGNDYKPLPCPVPVLGALPGRHSLARGTTALPCPALRGGRFRGLHSPDFRHNLVSVNELQQSGVEVFFLAGTRHAHCRDHPATPLSCPWRQAHLLQSLLTAVEWCR